MGEREVDTHRSQLKHAVKFLSAGYYCKLFAMMDSNTPGIMIVGAENIGFRTCDMG